jgi:ATP-dependent helicase/nuclease subunit B
MRKSLGLEQPERAIGLSAHDFSVLASAPRAVMTRALKTEGSPTVPSRWWQRLVQLARGLGLEDRLTTTISYSAQARVIGAPEMRDAPAKRPEPRPPVDKRPRRMSVTEIETWLRDPYAIYAKHVLRLSPLDPLDGDTGPLEHGTSVHVALERFLKAYPNALPPDAELKLIGLAEAVFDEIELPRAVRALWYPRFVRAARWFIDEERKRRPNIARSLVEIRGTRTFDGPAGSFELRARADRVDVLKSGGGAIVDYKTGNPPTKTQVNTLLAPQLPLEGAILAAGGFVETGKLDPAELVYIRFGGGAEPGEVRNIGEVSELVKDAEDRLVARIAAFDSAHTPYVPRVRPFRADMPGDYDHLARVREWSLTGWEGDEK